MPTRKEMDKPATAIAVVLGLVALGGSLPFAVDAYCREHGCGGPAETPKTFDVRWGSVDLAAVQGTVGERSESTTDLDVGGHRAATLRLVLAPNSCTDTYNPTLSQQPASFQYEVILRAADGAEEPVKGAAGTLSCNAETRANGFNVTFIVANAPDIGSAQGHSLAEATRSVSQNITRAPEGTAYVLKLTSSRPASSLPLPPGVPGAETNASLRMSLEATEWAFSLNERRDEVVR
jgi:hypothetical protein